MRPSPTGGSERGGCNSMLYSGTAVRREAAVALGIAINRGISLLHHAVYAKPREALLQATVPNASTDVRADAYQDLSLSFYREADGLATQNNHADAQKMFREALDAAKRSLHLRPGDPNTAWNMELAARRVREEEQKQKEEEQKQKDQQKQDGDKQNQDQNQDPNQQQDQNKDQKQDGDKGDEQKQDQGKPEPQKPEDKKGQPDKPKQPDKPEADQKQPAEPDKQQPPEKALPPEAAQALDSLENGEENFERYRARQRASRERRAPEKDW